MTKSYCLTYLFPCVIWVESKESEFTFEYLKFRTKALLKLWLFFSGPSCWLRTHCILTSEIIFFFQHRGKKLTFAVLNSTLFERCSCTAHCECSLIVFFLLIFEGLRCEKKDKPYLIYHVTQIFISTFRKFSSWN